MGMLLAAAVEWCHPEPPSQRHPGGAAGVAHPRRRRGAAQEKERTAADAGAVAGCGCTLPWPKSPCLLAFTGILRGAMSGVLSRVHLHHRLIACLRLDISTPDRRHVSASA